MITESKISFEDDAMGLISSIASVSLSINTPIYLKGGYIRDRVTQTIHGNRNTSKDLDFFLPNNINLAISVAIQKGFEIVERRARKKTPLFLLQHHDFLRYRCELGILMSENAGFYDERPSINQSVIEDAKYTDLNVNTLSILARNIVLAEFPVDKIIDPLGIGFDGIKLKQISLISPRSVYRNPENMLRTLITAYKLKFAVSPETSDLIRTRGQLLKKVKSNLVQEMITPILLNNNDREMFLQILSDHNLSWIQAIV